MAQNFNRVYVTNKDRRFSPFYLQGENYSFYCNFDEPINDPNFASFELWVIDVNGNQIAKIDSALQFIPTSIYTYIIYTTSFVFPQIKDSYYYFQIWDSSTSSEKCRSNSILVDSQCLEYTTPVKFRNNDQIYGFRYDLIPDFYQMFRLPISQIDAIDVKSERVQYRQSSNGRNLRNSKSFRDILIILEMYWANEDDFFALSAMLEHNEIYISGNLVMDMEQVKVELPHFKSEQSKGTFKVIVQDYDLDRNLIENYGDFILWGGNTWNNLSTFVKGN
jgi:hypothetical protein